MRAQHLWLLGEHLPVKVNDALGDIRRCSERSRGRGRRRRRLRAAPIQPHKLLLHINLLRLFYSDEQEGRKRFIRRAPISHGGRCH